MKNLKLADYIFMLLGIISLTVIIYLLWFDFYATLKGLFYTVLFIYLSIALVFMFLIVDQLKELVESIRGIDIQTKISDSLFDGAKIEAERIVKESKN